MTLGSTRLFRDAFDAGSERLGDLTPGTLVIGIGTGVATPIRWFGMPVTAKDAVVSGRTIDVKATGTAHFFSVAVDRKRLEGELPGYFDAARANPSLSGGYLVRNPTKIQKMRECLEAVFALSDAAPAALNRASLRATLETAVVGLLRRVIGGRWIAPSASLGRRLRAVRGCERYIRLHIDEPMSLQDLSDFSGLRPRSLISAFEAFTGFTPMAYVKAQRLAGVRKELLSAHRDCLRIIDIAMDWGFVHMGHFAADYRETFGEKPSETRHAAPRTAPQPA
ncbi:MAG: helix-turn-helix domain-containing protein [Candidatus Tumulicola sp.]